jgi:hypothetical protein
MNPGVYDLTSQYAAIPLGLLGGPTSIMMPDPPRGIIRSNLILNLDASQPGSYPGYGTTWKDQSGNGNNGTLVNGPRFNSANSGFIVFDGNNDYVNLRRPSSLTSLYTSNNKITLGVWIRINQNSGQDIVFDSGTSENIQIDIVGNALSFFIKTSGGAVRTSRTSLALNTWHYCTGTYDGSVIILYRNGRLVSQAVLTGNITPDTSSFTIGNWISNPVYGLSGNIAAFQIYNRALTPPEVFQNFNALRSRFGV